MAFFIRAPPHTGESVLADFTHARSRVLGCTREAWVTPRRKPSGLGSYLPASFPSSLQGAGRDGGGGGEDAKIKGQLGVLLGKLVATAQECVNMP